MQDAVATEPLDSNRLRNCRAARAKAVSRGDIDLANALSLAESLEQECLELRAKLRLANGVIRALRAEVSR